MGDNLYGPNLSELNLKFIIWNNFMAKAVFIFGGCRSGKSSYAVQRVKNSHRVLYLATSRILDDEMQRRIEKHRKDRPKEWEVLESPYLLIEAIQQLESGAGSPVSGAEFAIAEFAIVDCLTMYLANHFDRHGSLGELEEQERFEDWLRGDMQGLMAAIRSAKLCEVLLISNEVGAGIVPVSGETRFFRDMCGLMNQWAARESDEVIKMEAGLVNRLK
jgi:adenosylcobinamide kinase / adenosylcobinamide-phosphate guanylyltransferase